MPFGKKNESKKEKSGYPTQPAYPTQQAAGTYPTQPPPAPTQQQMYAPPAYGNEPPPPYTPQAAAGYQPPPQGYAAPPQGYAAPPQGYAAPPQGYAAPPQGYAAPPQGYAAPPQGYAAPRHGRVPAGPNSTVIVQGGFDAGARFDGVAQPNVPPPPPGCVPNAAQMAMTRGSNVVVTQRPGNFWEGGSDGGYVMF